MLMPREIIFEVVNNLIDIIIEISCCFDKFWWTEKIQIKGRYITNFTKICEKSY